PAETHLAVVGVGLTDPGEHEPGKLRVDAVDECRDPSVARDLRWSHGTLPRPDRIIEELTTSLPASSPA
ncbi:hypothetical protein ACFFOP_31530, partial [Sinosporangium siamense]|uniref:hypothetical protein n=1 Tax=Sinosporangium siamense TaxID=1367973 RepID=UPI0035EEC6F3